jgi:hypothetical protein
MWTGIRLRFRSVELIVSLCPVVLDTITLVLEEELAVSPIVYAAETSPRARSGEFLSTPCRPDLSPRAIKAADSEFGVNNT